MVRRRSIKLLYVLVVGLAHRAALRFRNERGLNFPAIAYRYAAIQAMLADAWGEKARAREFASQALVPIGSPSFVARRAVAGYHLRQLRPRQLILIGSAA